MKSGQLFVVFLSVFARIFAQTTDVTIPNFGTVQGQFSSAGVAFERYSAFYGVPYAESPQGNLRFARAQTKTPLNAVFDATAPKDGCIRPQSPDGQEDCLHLNIFVPGVFNANAQIPVMVFLQDDANEIQGQFFTRDQLTPVILVTVSYRVGVFGFLTTGDANIPGNMGLSDQAKALEFVQSYIQYFGGDSQKITLIGQSFGAVSTALHTLKSNTVQRVIIQSQFTPRRLPVRQDLTGAYETLVASVNCERTDVNEQITCLRSASTAELSGNGAMFMSPVLDGDMITSQPEDLLASGDWSNIEAIVGFTDNEAFGLASSLLEGPFLNTILENGLSSTLLQSVDPIIGACAKFVGAPASTDFLLLLDSSTDASLENLDALKTSIEQQYFSDTSNPIVNRDQFLLMVRDCVYSSFAMEMAQAFTASVYVFKQDSNMFGASHGAEIPFIFGDFSSYTVQNQSLATSLMSTWRSFAYGNEER